jgi:threonine synthase
VISTASGLKFADFKVGYHEGKLAEVAAPKYRNIPVELPEDYNAVRDALLRGLDR